MCIKPGVCQMYTYLQIINEFTIKSEEKYVSFAKLYMLFYYKINHKLKVKK
jgi:hypothetical protein